MACLRLVFNRLILLIGHYRHGSSLRGTIFLSDVVEVDAMMLNRTGMLAKQGGS